MKCPAALALLAALALPLAASAQVYVPSFGANGAFSYRQVTPAPWQGVYGLGGYYGGGYGGYGYGAPYLAAPYPRYAPYLPGETAREVRLLRWSLEDAAIRRPIRPIPIR